MLSGFNAIISLEKLSQIRFNVEFVWIWVRLLALTELLYLCTSDFVVLLVFYCQRQLLLHISGPGALDLTYIRRQIAFLLFGRYTSACFGYACLRWSSSCLILLLFFVRALLLSFLQLCLTISSVRIRQLDRQWACT